MQLAPPGALNNVSKIVDSTCARKVINTILKGVEI
jgi:hypothetical protein